MSVETTAGVGRSVRPVNKQQFRQGMATSGPAASGQLTTDGHRASFEAVEEAFGADVDYAQLVSPVMTADISDTLWRCRTSSVASASAFRRRPDLADRIGNEQTLLVSRPEEHWYDSYR